MGSFDWIDHALLAEFETEGLITSTFLRLDDDRRTQVLEALFAESARSGPERINIKTVAKTAGVPVGSLYQYFGDREKLARFAAVLIARKLAGELELFAPYLEAMPLREAMTLYLKSGIDWSVQESASFRSFVAAAYGAAPKGSVFAESVEEEGDDWYSAALVRPVAEALQSLVRRIVLAAAGRGELKDGLDADAAARIANVLLIAVGDARMMPGLDAYYRFFGGTEAPDSRIDEAIEFICRSLLR
jgi:AcrR family transcriptional regulator